MMNSPKTNDNKNDNSNSSIFVEKFALFRGKWELDNWDWIQFCLADMYFYKVIRNPLSGIH